MAVQPNQQLTLDESQQRGFVKFFKSLPEKAAATVRLFDRGDYYTVHGADARLAAEIVFNSTAGVRELGAAGNKVDSLLLKPANFEMLARQLLLVRQYRVEVYTNRSKAKDGNDWHIEYKGSPGNLSQFEDILWQAEHASDGTEGVGGVVMAAVVVDGGKAVAVATVDTVARTFALGIVPDDGQLAALEGLLVRHAPRECLHLDTSNAEIVKVLSRVGVLGTPRKRADWSADGVAQDLNRLLAFDEGQQRNAMALPQMALTEATAALAALIKYLELGSDEGNEGQFTLSTLAVQGFARLDAAAVRALNLLPSARVTGRQNCVLGLLDRCRTMQGHRLVAQWLVQPLTDRNAVCERHDIVAALMDDAELRAALTDDHLRRLPDLAKLGNKMSRGKFTLRDCFIVYQAVQRLPSLLESLSRVEQCAAVAAMLISPLADLARDLAPFEQMVETTLDLDLVAGGDYLVKPDFDDDLKELRQEMDDLEAKMKKQLQIAASNLGLDAAKTIKLETNPQYGYFYRVTLKEEKALRNHKTYKRLDSNKGGVRFRDDKLSALNESYVALRDSYASHQTVVVNEIVGIAKGYGGVVGRLSSVVAVLDALVGFAVAAADAPKPWVRPIVHEAAPKGGMLRLTQLRHPCVEIQDGVSFIANDVDLKQDETTQYVVTGPNMGGKSTFIRSVGVAVLLAQIGSFVPCDAAELSLVDAILARVGADDSQLNGVSTFMNEMVETAAVVKTATERSLVIVDELGRGTSTYDGCGMAWAIAEHLATVARSFTLFATHFHELSALADSVPTVANRHVTAAADGDRLTLLYAVRPGFCDQSFGLHVARMARFPPAVLEMAARKQAELEAGQARCSDASALEEGKKMVREFLEACKKLASDQACEPELAKQVEQLKVGMRAAKNSYVDSLLA